MDSGQPIHATSHSVFEMGDAERTSAATCDMQQATLQWRGLHITGKNFVITQNSYSTYLFLP